MHLIALIIIKKKIFLINYSFDFRLYQSRLERQKTSYRESQRQFVSSVGRCDFKSLNIFILYTIYQQFEKILHSIRTLDYYSLSCHVCIEVSERLRDFIIRMSLEILLRLDLSFKHSTRILGQNA